jgi:autotransporter-associated beta strand protein
VGSGAEVLFTGAGANFTTSEPFRIAGAGNTDAGAIAVISSANPTISGPVTLTGDATVTVSSTASATFSNPTAFTSLANQNLTLAGGANASGVKVIAGNINLGTGNLIKTQSGKWTLTAANTYSGTTTISAGTLELGNGLAGNDGTISNSPSVLNNGALVFNRFGTDSYSGSISGGGTVTKSGAGTQTLSGANTYVGATTVSGGTLKLGNATALGFGGLQTTSTASTVVSSGFMLDLNGTSTVNEPIILNGTGVGASGALINSSSTIATIGSGIAGAQVGAITGTGDGYSTAPTVAISGTGSGATATASLGVTAASFAIAGGTTVYSTAPTVTIAGGAGTTATATATLTAGVVTGITITNAGTGFTVAPTIAFSGGTITTAGTNPTGTGNATEFTVSGIAVTAPGSGYTGTPTYTFGSGNAIPGTVTLSSVVLASNSSIGGSGDIAISSAISETGGARTLTKVGAGTLTLSGPQAYSSLAASEGRTTLDSSLANATITNAAGAILNVNANANGSTVNVAGNTDFSVSQTLAALNIGDGGMVRLGSPAFAAASDASTAPEDLFAGAADPVQPVPEPGSFGLLALGVLGLPGRRRATK